MSIKIGSPLKFKKLPSVMVEWLEETYLIKRIINRVAKKYPVKGICNVVRCYKRCKYDHHRFEEDQLCTLHKKYL